MKAFLKIGALCASLALTAAQADVIDVNFNFQINKTNDDFSTAGKIVEGDTGYEVLYTVGSEFSSDPSAFSLDLAGNNGGAGVNYRNSVDGGGESDNQIQSRYNTQDNINEYVEFTFDYDVVLNSISISGLVGQAQVTVAESTPITTTSSSIDLQSALLKKGDSLRLSAINQTDGSASIFRIKTLDLDVNTAPVPEPSAFALLVTALGLFVVRRRK